MTTFVVQANIPVPPRTRKAGGSKYPFAKMKPGEMFYAPEGVKAATLRSSVGVFSRANPGYKFAVRIDAEGRLGCWLVSVKDAAAPVVDTEANASKDENSGQTEGNDTQNQDAE